MPRKWGVPNIDMPGNIKVLDRLKATYEDILNLGYNKELDAAGILLLRLINILSLAAIIATTLSLFVEDLDSGWSLTPHYLFIGISILVLILNYHHRRTVAKFILILLIPIIQSTSIIFFDHSQNGSELTIIPFICITPFVFIHRWIKLSILLLLVSLFATCLYYKGYSFSTSYFFNLTIVTTGMSIGIYLLVNHLQMWATDVTKKNKELEKKNKKLESLVRQNKLKSELLAMVSHDLKGPAQSFTMLAEKAAFLLRKREYDTLLEMANYFESSSKKLFRDIDYLLNWTISQQEYIKTYFTRVNINKIIEDVVQDFEFMSVKKEVELNIEIRKDTYIYSDPHILSIILKNIVENAIKYTPIRTAVHIKFEQDDQLNCITITDQGPGIDPGLVTRIESGIYEKSKDGYGIGLGISLSLVRSLNGTLKFEKGITQGTQVVVSLPQHNDKEIGKNQQLPSLSATNMELSVLHEADNC